MTRILTAAVIGLAVAAAGCGPAAVLESGGPADSVAALPAELGLAAAGDEAYQYEATAGRLSIDDESPSGEVGAFIFGFTWYFLRPVDNDDVPIGLQPLDQKASWLDFTFGFGDFEYDSGAPDSDVFQWEISARYVLGDETQAEGLGFEASYGRRTVEDFTGGPNDLEYTNISLGALYYIPLADSLGGALIPKLSYRNSNVDSGPTDYDLGGLDFGVEFYGEILPGQYINAEFSLGLWEAENGTNADVTDTNLRVDYYPVKALGVGIDWGGRDWDLAGQDEDRFGIHASLSLDDFAPGLDVNLSWENREQDNNDEEDILEITVDYRF